MMVPVLDEDPGLGSHLSARALTSARHAAIAPLLELDPGPAHFRIEGPATRGHLGLLVIHGLLARFVSHGSLGSTEFVGPGDAVRPWIVPAHAPDVRVRWEALTSARVAVLDRGFADRVRPWPEITAVLLDRSSSRIQSQLMQAAIRQAKRVEDRVLLALWLFAGRWGQVGAESRTLTLPVTGKVLAQIVGARRQSVSTALGALQTRGAVERLGQSTWRITQAPRELRTIEPGRRDSDRQLVSPRSRTG
jgi:CRP/FNR family transcriptional regulator, cyclic AMP receptor protein